MKHLFFVGTAGSGKSSLVAAYKEMLDSIGVDAITVNLDPGAEALAYVPDIDIRDWVSMSEVMEEFGLGPNGAQIAAADLMAINIGRMTEVLDTFRADYALVDTPGQLELFAFRESSERIITAFGQEDSMLIYLLDPTLCRTSNGFISLMMLSSIVEFRLGLPVVNLLSKSDILAEEDKERLLTWFGDIDALGGSLLDEGGTPGYVVGAELFKALENLGVFGEIRAVSAHDGEGLGDIYAMAQLQFFGGEDTVRD
jgi:GTPase SAR1 family protein